MPFRVYPHTIPFGGFQETPPTKKVLYGKKIDLAIKMGKAALVPISDSGIYEKPVLRTYGPPPSSLFRSKTSPHAHASARQ